VLFSSRRGEQWEYSHKIAIIYKQFHYFGTVHLFPRSPTKLQFRYVLRRTGPGFRNVYAYEKFCRKPSDGRISRSKSTVFVWSEIWVLSFFLSLGVGWDWVHLVRRPLTGLLYQPRMIDDDECEAVGGMRIGRGNRSTRRKPARATLSTTNPTWFDSGSNPGRHGGKPATNRLSYCTARY
jgi:hypothetical protein